MKDKKNSRAKKVLLMATSCVLVAGISVGATLAYLTAKTNDKDNKFKASGGIKGEVLEPTWDVSKATNFAPGDEIPKDPKIDNDTSDANVWVGAKIEFFLDVGNGDEEVDYATFSKFATLTGWVGTDWNELSSTKTNDKASYYFYNKLLLADTNNATDEMDGNNYKTNTLGNHITGSQTTDNTTDLFTKVTPAGGIDINPKYVASNPNTAQGQMIPMYDNNGTMTAKTLVTEVADLPADADDIDLNKLAFTKFNFKIKITGYGIKDDIDVTGTTGTGANKTFSNVNSADCKKVTDVLLAGLGGVNTTTGG